MGLFRGVGAAARHINFLSRTGHPRQARATLRPSACRDAGRRLRRADGIGTATPLPVCSKRRAHRLHHPSVVPAPRHGAVPSRVPRPAARDRRPADQRRARRLPAPLFGAGGHRRADRPGPRAGTTSRPSRRRARRPACTFIDPDTAMNAHSLTAARHAAGAVVLATDLVMRKECRTAFCAVRPPGHHAERNRAMGFCLFNNVAVGAAHALAAHGIRRAAIVDFDVHHGNGTEDIFSERFARADGLDVPASAVPVFRPRQPGREHGQHAARRRHRQRRSSAMRCASTGCPRSSGTGPRSSTFRRASTRIARIRWPASS